VKLQLVSPPEPPRPDTAAEAFRYWAFLSYSHHDKAIAKRLQKQLETYRVPKRLVGRETPHGAVPARVSPVFRDRDELHAGSDLKASVQDALSRSRWLIVVCTPDSARSPWVNREIIEFKKLHGERRVLALIARGEPFASDMPGREAEECFPAALRRALTAEGKAEGEALEPIAADMRREGDGAHRAALKLLAGMLGVPFDELVRRDVQRRVRWLTALASASVVGVVVFAFLAVMAVQARNEAEYQRQQAEGLIEFMLGDLRKKLEPVGRLEVLDSVGEKALAYYGGQDAGKLDATALGHRSRAMHLIGEVRDIRGQLPQAQAAFEQAADTTAQLLAKSPRDGQRVFDHAQSVFWVGYAAWKRADGKLAKTKFAEYLELAKRLVQIDGSRSDWRAEMAHAQVNLGVVQLSTGQLEEARLAFTEASQLFADLTQVKPDLVYDLAGSHGWLAMAHSLMGRDAEALQWQRRRIALLRELPGADKNRTTQHEMLLALLSASRYELALGLEIDAQAAVRQALDIAEGLTNADPNNFRWQLDACAARVLNAEVLLARKKFGEARAESSAIRTCLLKIGKDESTGVWDTVLSKASAFTTLLVLADESEREVVASTMKTFLDRTVSQLTAETLDRQSLVVGLASAYGALGDKASSGPTAAAAWQRVRDLLAPYSATANGAALTHLARAHLRTNDLPAAVSLVDRVARSGYRHPVFVELVYQLRAVKGASLPTPPGEKK
jgi:tetratricopeptide (TPR) repeat protein